MTQRQQKKLIEKQKAIVIFGVIKDTGRLNLTEAYRRYYPNQKPENAHINAHKMLKGNVMDELEKLLKIRDPDLQKKLTPEVIVQDLVKDITMLNEMMEEARAGQKMEGPLKAALTYEDVIKMLNAKVGKQKLLGMAIGMWKAEKPQEREEAADELMKSLMKIGGKDEKV